MRLAAIALLVLPAIAQAQSICRIYEYAELKDMPAETLKTKYCDYDRAMSAMLTAAVKELQAGRSGSSQMAQSDAIRCSQEADRIARVLQSKNEAKPICTRP